MPEDAALIDRFYPSFATRDGAGTAVCSAPGATLADPMFGTDVPIELPGRGRRTARWIERYAFRSAGIARGA